MAEEGESLRPPPAPAIERLRAMTSAMAGGFTRLQSDQADPHDAGCVGAHMLMHHDVRTRTRAQTHSHAQTNNQSIKLPQAGRVVTKAGHQTASGIGSGPSLAVDGCKKLVCAEWGGFVQVLPFITKRAYGCEEGSLLLLAEGGVGCSNGEPLPWRCGAAPQHRNGHRDSNILSPNGHVITPD